MLELELETQWKETWGRSAKREVKLAEKVGEERKKYTAERKKEWHRKIKHRETSRVNAKGRKQLKERSEEERKRQNAQQKCTCGFSSHRLLEQRLSYRLLGRDAVYFDNTRASQPN